VLEYEVIWGHIEFLFFNARLQLLRSSTIVLIHDSFGFGLNGWWIETPDKTAVRLMLVKHVPLQALPSRPTSSAS